MYQKTTLDSGLRVITSTMPHTLSVAVNVFVGVGSRYETDAEAGISHFIEHLLFKGTEKRPTSRDISEAIEGVGGILNGGTDKELTVYWCKVAQSHFPRALDVLLDILRHSKFDPHEIEKERQVIIEEINMSRDSPQHWVNILVDKLLWPGHALGRDIAGSKESVGAITREMMLNYMDRQYQPVRITVAVAGNVEHQEVVNAVSQNLDDWTSQSPLSEYTPYQAQPPRRMALETRDIEQAHLCLALPGLSFRHPQRFTLDLLNIVLGEGMSSRLFVEIRDRLGLAYSIHSYIDHLHDSGSMMVYAGVEPKNLPTVITAILDQLDKLKKIIPDSEITKAKELAKGRLLLRMEDSRNVASWIGGQEILTGRVLDVEQVVDIIDAITADELKKLAEELLVGSQLCLAVVGPLKAEEPLENLLKL